MPRIVRCGLVQAACDATQGEPAAIKQAALQKHQRFIEEAASRGVRILCLQEIFFGPYFCAEQDPKWYALAEPIPGPTVEWAQGLARKHEMVLVVPIYEAAMPGVYYNTAAVIDADGALLGIYRKNHIPHLQGFWEKFYFKPGNLGYPTFKTRYAQVGVYICYDRHFPEGARLLGLNGAEIVFNPSATSRGLSRYLWQLEQPAAAVANEYFVGAINRIGVEDLGDNDFYGTTYFVDPEAQFVGEVASDKETELVVRDLDPAKLREVRDRWQFYRDRRPDAYGPLTAP
jgi:beta-ureidopropionase